MGWFGDLLRRFARRNVATLGDGQPTGYNNVPNTMGQYLI